MLLLLPQASSLAAVGHQGQARQPTTFFKPVASTREPTTRALLFPSSLPVKRMRSDAQHAEVAIRYPMPRMFVHPTSRPHLQ